MRTRPRKRTHNTARKTTKGLVPRESLWSEERYCTQSSFGEEGGKLKAYYSLKPMSTDELLKNPTATQ